MKQQIARSLLLFAAVAFMSGSITGCKSKVKDADIKTAAEAALATNPDFKGISVDVKDGVATISGEVKDASAQAAALRAPYGGGAAGMRRSASPNRSLIEC